MAWVETRITRVSQPQDACSIDWNNPLASQLTSAWWGDSNFVGPAGANKLGAYGVVGSVGAGRFFTAGSVKVLPANSFGYTESESRLAVIKVPSGINRNISSTSAIGAVQLRTANGTDLVYVEKQIAVKISAAGVLSVGETCVVGVSRDASTAKLYKSGRLIGTSAGRVLAASSIPAIGQDGSGSATFEGDIYLHLAWSRVLSDAEFKALSDNPWQIFEPEVQRIWIDDTVSAGGAATVIPIGIQATGSVGTPSATGAARATPAGVSASSAVGTPIAVGGASIPATVLPAGVQATAAIGTVSARGAAVAQPAGVTASGAVGTPVAIAGANVPATVLPAGVQAASAVGKPTVTAAAIAQPVGVSAIGYVGTPTIATGVSGVAVCYPAGVQAIGQVGTLIATGAAWTAAVGVQAVASVGMPFAYEGALVSTTAGAQTRPSRLQSSNRPSRIQTGTRASR